MLPIEDQMIYGMFYSLLLKYPELGGNFERMGAFATPMCELDQFLGGETASTVVFIFAEVILKQEFVH